MEILALLLVGGAGFLTFKYFRGGNSAPTIDSGRTQQVFVPQVQVNELDLLSPGGGFGGGTSYNFGAPTEQQSIFPNITEILHKPVFEPQKKTLSLVTQ